MSKYATISKIVGTKKLRITPIKSGKCYETTDGFLLQVIGSQIQQIVRPGYWVEIEKARETRPSNRKPTHQASSLNYKYRLSYQLSQITRSTQDTRIEVIKKLWSFIRKHSLQDAKNRRMINVGDNPLTKQLFDNKKQISMFEMTKYVSKHMFYLDGKTAR